MNLKELIKKGESEKVEFKKSLRLKDEIGEVVSAFSNSEGGTIFVGVDDKNNEPIGVEIGKKTIEALANHIKQNTDPPVFPSIRVESLADKEIIVVDVKEADEKPVLFKGRPYRRVGKSTHKASAAEIRKLVVESKKIYWDEQVCEGATLDDIDWEFIENLFIPLYETTSEKKIIGEPKNIIESLRCIKDNKPTNAGILLFGKEPQRFFMNSYIALPRYRGEEVGIERLDYKEFSGNLFRQIDNCDKYIKEHIAIMSRLLPYRVRRQDIPEYGLFSIRELVTNAVCHRDYQNQHTKVIIKMFSNKIEFYNPGGLGGEVTPENITEKQYSRNPVIARVLAKVDYIEDVGEGWDKIIDEHKKHALKPELPLIKADSDSVLINLFSTKDKFGEEKLKVELNERQIKAMKFIEEKGKITNKEYLSLNPEISDRTARNDFKNLVEKGLLKSVGERKNRYYVTQ